ncbi:MAG TPA: prepilin-type N-terminal cleavage/methylation domain-containing protein [Tepidisphaeraceae bacterium]|nr:prepilin-type N-terminal cleavage/methylation domain-containing protein [Tepidisphaeraceae bacterium]
MTHRPLQPRRPAGFTVVELLVVIGIIALLITILVPTISKARAASKTTVCASNLHQIFQAGQTWSLENGNPMPGTGWVGCVLQQGGKGITRCPEGDLLTVDPVAPVNDELTQIAAGYSVYINDTKYSIPCVPGQWARLENLTSNSFELSFEDQANSGGGDMSYNNVRLKFTDNGNGTMTIEVKPSFGGYSSNLIDSTGATIMTNIGQNAGAANAGKSLPNIPINYTNSTFSNYGVNKNAGDVFGKADKVYGIDYVRSVVDPALDDWKNNAPNQFPLDDTGTLTFARHNRKANVLYGDGSVKLESVSPTELNPAAVGPNGEANRDVYWELGK